MRWVASRIAVVGSLARDIGQFPVGCWGRWYAREDGSSSRVALSTRNSLSRGASWTAWMAAPAKASIACSDGQIRDDLEFDVLAGLKPRGHRVGQLICVRLMGADHHADGKGVQGGQDDGAHAPPVRRLHAAWGLAVRVAGSTTVCASAPRWRRRKAARGLPRRWSHAAIAHSRDSARSARFCRAGSASACRSMGTGYGGADPHWPRE